MSLDKKPKRAPASLFSKILSIQSEAEASDKDITITMGGRTFKATTIEAVLDVYLPLCKKYKVGIIPIRVEPVVIPNTSPQNFIAIYHYALVDTENADSHEFSVLTTGNDGGDKAAGKAATYALKYAYLQLFSGRRGDDPDFNGEPKPPKQEQKRQAQAESKPAQSNAPAKESEKPAEKAQADTGDPLKAAIATIKAKFSLAEVAKTQKIPAWKGEYQPFTQGITVAIKDAPLKKQVNDFAIYWWVCCAVVGEKDVADAEKTYEAHKSKFTKANRDFIEEMLKRRKAAKQEDRQPGEDG